MSDSFGKCRYLAPVYGTLLSGSNGDSREFFRERPRLHGDIFEIQRLRLQQKPRAKASQVGKHQNRHAHEASRLRPAWALCAESSARILIRVQNHRPREEVDGSVPPSHQD